MSLSVCTLADNSSLNQPTSQPLLQPSVNDLEYIIWSEELTAANARPLAESTMMVVMAAHAAKVLHWEIDIFDLSAV